MTVRVVLAEYSDDYTEGRSWHVDDDGCLHVRGDAGNVATYAHGVWITAMRLPAQSAGPFSESPQTKFVPCTLHAPLNSSRASGNCPNCRWVPVGD